MRTSPWTDHIFLGILIGWGTRAGGRRCEHHLTGDLEAAPCTPCCGIYPAIKNSTHIHNTCWGAWKTHFPPTRSKKEFRLLFLLRLKGLRGFRNLEKKNMFWRKCTGMRKETCACQTQMWRVRTQAEEHNEPEKQTSYSNLRVNPAKGRADVSVALWSTLILHPLLSWLSLCQPLSAQTSLQSPLFFLFSLPKSDISG